MNAEYKFDSNNFKHMFDDLFLCINTWLVMPMLSASNGGICHSKLVNFFLSMEFLLLGQLEIKQLLTQQHELACEGIVQPTMPACVGLHTGKALEPEWCPASCSIDDWACTWVSEQLKMSAPCLWKIGSVRFFKLHASSTCTRQLIVLFSSQINVGYLQMHQCRLPNLCSDCIVIFNDIVERWSKARKESQR